MYFYDENKTLYENFKVLLSDYNRVCAINTNNNIVIDNPIPAPSATGTYVLKSINGVLTWVAE